MLEIFISNQKVDLSIDIQIALTIENPFMLQDRVPTPYSLTFELPATARNLKTFNFPNRIASHKSNATVTRSCRILFQSVTIATGIVTITNFEQTIKAAFKGADLTETMRSYIYEMPMEFYEFDTPDWTDIDFDDPHNYAGRYRQMAIDAANGLDPRMVVAPVKVETDNMPLQFSYQRQVRGEFVTSLRYPQRMMDTEYINYYNPEEEEFALRSDTPAVRGEPYAIVHAPIFPFTRVHYILSSIFGSALASNIFDAPELEDLVVPSTYFQNWKNNASARVQFNGPGGMMFLNKPPFGSSPIFPPGYPTDPFFRLNDFLPAYPGPDLLKELLKLFCASMVIKNGRFDIRLNKDIIAEPVATKWDEKLIGKPTISTEKKHIYKYGYEGEDPYIPENDAVSVTSLRAMFTDADAQVLDPGDQVTRVYNVTSLGAYYECIIEQLEPAPSPKPNKYMTFKLLDGGYGKAPDTTQDTFDAVASLKPLPLVPKQYWVTAENAVDIPPELYWWAVPYYQGDRGARPEGANIMFHRGMTDVLSDFVSHQYPLLSPYRVTPSNYPVGDLSLKWTGDDGLLANFHAGFKNWIERDRARVSGSFLLTPLDLHNLDITSKVHLQGRNFYIERIQVNIRANRIDPAHIDLVEA
ncbi:MAG TPA: hypothetical protein VNQ80_12210 [Parapedobacter sp.]|uniref:hypothetical protein n=1 Tax=Parapedobacter sp. TaxID=1958893 RepID=UPI002B76B330|nr:hypothetical protein [Parapedobacter sp.]HWK58100.1 hypothetical protein [Parapedobacter sp.]